MPDHDHAFDCAQINSIERLRDNNSEMHYCPICGHLARGFRDGGGRAGQENECEVSELWIA